MSSLPNDLEGPLALAVQAAWEEKLANDEVAQMTQRIRERLSQKQVAPHSQSQAGMIGKRSLAWLTLAASLLLGAFFLGRQMAVSQPKHLALPPQEQTATTSSLHGIYSPHLGFVAKMTLQMTANPQSDDPHSFLLFGKGPKESIALGQSFPLNLPKTTSEAYIHLFEPRVSPRSRVLRKHPVPGSFAASPDGRWIVTQTGFQIEVETENGKQLSGDWSQVERVQFVGDSHLLLTRSSQKSESQPQNTVQIVSYPELRVLKEIADLETQGVIKLLDQSQSVQTLFGLFPAKGKKLLVHDVVADKTSAELPDLYVGEVHAIAISPDRKAIAVGGAESAVFLHDAVTGERKQTLLSDSQPATLRSARAVAFSPDGRYLAVAEMQYLVVFNVQSGKLVQRFPTSSGGAEEIRWSADGSTLTTVHSNYIQSEQDGPEMAIYPHVAQWTFKP